MGIHQKPAWLEELYNQKFFAPCSYHESSKKNEKNVYCLDCCTSICPHCVLSHRLHRLLQIRRYVYHDVVRLEDLENLVDCSNVQAYTINNSKVVFIKKRPQNRQLKGSGNNCTSCNRGLQDPFIHCSLGCKVDYALKHYSDLSRGFLRKCKTLTLGPDFLIPQDNMGYDDIITNDTNHSTIVDSDDPVSWSSGSAGSGSFSYSSGSDNISTMHNMCIEKVVRKKRSELVYDWSRSSTTTTNHHYNQHHSHDYKDPDEDMATNMSRRKGVPQRSPLC
ncbi:Protein RGF1 INDUCIBLE TRANSCRIPTION FACTOR 1 [Linum grandiflorum]